MGIVLALIAGGSGIIAACQKGKKKTQDSTDASDKNAWQSDQHGNAISLGGTGTSGKKKPTGNTTPSGPASSKIIQQKPAKQPKPTGWFASWSNPEPTPARQPA